MVTKKFACRNCSDKRTFYTCIIPINGYICKYRVFIHGIHKNIQKEKAEHFVTLKFNIESTAEIENVFIAGEEAEYIKLNGSEIDLAPCGYYVDKSIKKYKAGKLLNGLNEIEIKTPITKGTSISFGPKPA